MLIKKETEKWMVLY